MVIWPTAMLIAMSAATEPTLSAEAARSLMTSFVAAVADKPQSADDFFEPGATIGIRGYEGFAEVDDFAQAMSQCRSESVQEIAARPGWNLDGTRDFEVLWDCPSIGSHTASKVRIDFFVRQKIVTGLGDYLPAAGSDRSLPFRYGFTR